MIQATRAPTAKQADIIDHDFKIPVPDSRAECNRLIGYILDEERSPQERVTTIRAVRGYFQKWLGTTVQLNSKHKSRKGTLGKVQSVRVRSLAQLAAVRRKRDKDLHPVTLLLQLDSGEKIDVPLSHVKLFTRPQDRLLFPVIDAENP